MDHGSCDLREPDGAYMDRLDEQLPVLRSLFKFLLLCPLQLLLEEEYDLLDVPTRNQIQNNANCLSADLQVGALLQ